MARLFIPVKTRGHSVESARLDDLFLERRFGKTKYFAVIDSDTWQVEIIKNMNKHKGGTKHTPKIVSDTQASVVIAAHMGSGAYRGITTQGISILRGNVNENLDQIMKKYIRSELVAFKEADTKRHAHHR